MQSRFINKNIEEILKDRGLILLGIILSFTHIVYSFYFRPGSTMFLFLGEGTNGICFWPSSHCSDYRFLSEDSSAGVIYLYRSLAIASLLGFFFSKTRRWAILILALATVAKNFIIFHDARLYSGHNYITNFLFVIYFFLPHKRFYIKLQFVLVYFWSGIMHLNPQWLDGRLLEGWKFFPEQLTLQTHYVVFLQVVMSWSLLSQKLRWVLFAWIQLIFFHAISFTYIHWLYPVMMLLLLLAFPAFLWTKPPQMFTKRSFFREPGFVLACIFSLLQLVPRFISYETFLRGDGRFFYSMHQFHAGSSCQAIASQEDKKQTIDLLKVMPFVHERMKCEPVVIIAAAREICRKNKNAKSWHVTLRSTMTGDSSGEVQVFDIPNFCESEWN